MDVKLFVRRKKTTQLRPHSGRLRGGKIFDQLHPGGRVLAAFQDDRGVTTTDDGEDSALSGREGEEADVLADLLTEPVLGDPGDEITLEDHAGFRLRSEDLLHRAGKVGIEGTFPASRDEVVFLEELAEGSECLDDRCVGPFQLVGCQGVVFLRSCLRQVDVFEPVREGPAVPPGNGERGESRVGDGLAGGQHFCKCRGPPDIRIDENAWVVPDGRFMGHLVVDAVQGAVHAAVLSPHVGVVGVHRLPRRDRKRLQPSVAFELPEHAQLWEQGHVRCVPVLDHAAHCGGHVVPRGHEGHLRPGLVAEGVEYLLEVLLLTSGPGAGHGDTRTAQLFVPTVFLGESGACNAGNQNECDTAREQGVLSTHCC